MSSEHTFQVTLVEELHVPTLHRSVLRFVQSLDPENVVLRDEVYSTIEAKYKPMVYRKNKEAMKVLPSSLKATKTLAKIWNNAPDGRKAFWKDRAVEESVSHKAAFPQYRFRPKRGRNAQATSEAVTEVSDSPLFRSVAIQTSPCASPAPSIAALYQYPVVDGFMDARSLVADIGSSFPISPASTSSTSGGGSGTSSSVHTPDASTFLTQTMPFSYAQPFPMISQYTGNPPLLQPISPTIDSPSWPFSLQPPPSPFGASPFEESLEVAQDNSWLGLTGIYPPSSLAGWTSNACSSSVGIPSIAAAIPTMNDTPYTYTNSSFMHAHPYTSYMDCGAQLLCPNGFVDDYSESVFPGQWLLGESGCPTIVEPVSPDPFLEGLSMSSTTAGLR